MAEYVDSALFVYSEAGQIHLDDLLANLHGCSISPVSINELRDNSASLLKDISHVVVAAELKIIKEILQYAIDYGCSVGFLPLDSQKALKRCYSIPNDRMEMISLALSAHPSELDIVYCNNQILLFKGVVGWVPLIDSQKTTGKIKILVDALKKMSSLYLLPFNISTLGKSQNKISTAACGCVILETPELSYASSMIGDDCSFEDSMVSTVVIAPFSIVDYIKLLWLRIFSDPISKRMPPSVGYIKTTEMLIEPFPQLDVVIDGERSTSTPVHVLVHPGAVKVNRGSADKESKPKKVSEKEKFAVGSLPAGKELIKARHKRVPFFTYASEERFKDLFIALRDDARLDSIYIVLMVLSTMLATVGLYLDSASVIIGAMLLAPLMAPIISLSMSMLRYDQRLLRQSLKKVVVGILVALGVAFLLAVLSPYQPLTGEMQGRLSPSILDLVVAIVAGVAGAYTKSHREILQSLAGVAIAVALVPPLAVAGIGLGRFDLVFFINAFLLFVTNLIGIVLAAIVTFRVLGYSPAVRDKRALSVVLGSLLFISIPLTLSFWGITDQANFEKSWKQERFLVNNKYLIVNDAKIITYQDRKILMVDLYAREPLDRKDLNEFKRKVQQNFSDNLLIRIRLTYIP
jgi:uncharacterized hydrophobic protein (TIGR00271 family)